MDEWMYGVWRGGERGEGGSRGRKAKASLIL